MSRRPIPRLIPTAGGDRERLVRALIDAARDVQRRRAAVRSEQQ